MRPVRLSEVRNRESIEEIGLRMAGEEPDSPSS